jgi:cytochrome c-type biogenesis protein CcmH
VTAVPFIGFTVVALAAIAFVAVPLIRAQEKKNWALLLAAITVVTLGVGAGTYWLVGRPYLAQREARGLETKDPNGLIPFLIQRVRQYPNDATAWRYLGQAYMAARDPRNAAKALGRAISVEGKGDAELDAAYGEALVMANNGAITPEAEAAFQAAVAADASNVPARFYLGEARLEKGDRAGATQIWQGLLNDIPVTSRLHQLLVDRLAMASGQGPGGAAPDPRQMVAQLAARLKADPNDALGWVRLMRAYTVLGETEKAKQALSDARKAFPDNKDAQTAFNTAAKALKLQ